MIRAPGLALAAIVCFAASARAQVITGRVVDSAGMPVTHARVMARLEGDSSASSARITSSGDRGEFRLSVGTRGKYIVSALRMGYRPSPEQITNLTTGDARVDITMGIVRLSLDDVVVSGTGNFGCLAIDSPRQSARVKDWLRHAQDLIRSRRAIEREYTYRVSETADFRDTSNVLRRGVRDFVQRPDDSSHVGEIPAHFIATPFGMPLWGGRAGRLNYWASPDEGFILSTKFMRMCFDTSLAGAGRGLQEIRFRPFPYDQLGADRIGAIRMNVRGMITQIRMRFAPVNRQSPDETIDYTAISLDGEEYPFITSVVGSAIMGAKRQFRYSGFTRKPGALSPEP